jgi:hypothetical protein
MAATGAGLSLAPAPAAAQILDRNPPFQSPPSRPKLPPDEPDAALLPDDQSVTDAGWAADARPAGTPGTSADTPDGIDPQQAASRDLEAQEAQEAQDAGAPITEGEDQGDTDEFGEARARARRLPPQDGDLPTVIEEAVVPNEGVIDLNAPSPLATGEDVTLADMRNARDLAIYAGIAPSFDPLLLEAQETNPVFSTITSYNPEPFVPLGTRIGSFLLFTALQTDGDYNSNVFASPVALGDYALELWPSARLASNWANHAVEIRASGDLSYHDKFQTEDDRAYLVEALSRIDITRFSNIQAYVSHELAQESRSAINATSIGTRPDVVVNRASLAGNQRFNRLSVQVRGNVIDTRYGNDIVAGVTESNSDRDFTLYEEAVRPRWEFNPDLFFFSDISFNQRDYPTAAFTDGLNRTSNGERYRFGLSFGNTSQILNGSVSLGYGQQDYGNPLLVDINALLFDADLTWHITPLTALLFTAATDVAETTTTDTGGVLERQYALALRHSFSTRLIGTTGISYYNRDFVGGDLTEQQATGAAGLEYYLSREWVLFGRYQHTAFYTTSANGNYTVEEVQMGVRLRH